MKQYKKIMVKIFYRNGEILTKETKDRKEPYGQATYEYLKRLVEEEKDNEEVEEIRFRVVKA